MATATGWSLPTVASSATETPSSTARPAPSTSPRGARSSACSGPGYIYSYGDAKYYGGVGGCANYHGARTLLVSPDGKGYWIGTNDGSVIPLGSARKLGMPSSITSAPVGLMLQK